jgi:hypothetical protein
MVLANDLETITQRRPVSSASSTTHPGIASGRFPSGLPRFLEPHGAAIAQLNRD